MIMMMHVLRFLLLSICFFETVDAFLGVGVPIIAVSTTSVQHHLFLRNGIMVRKNMQNDNYDDNDDEDNDNDDDPQPESPAAASTATNVLGTALQCCCANVGGTGIGTGFYRNGYCSTGEQDIGRHTVCVQVTEDFLEYSKSVGNDLSTPIPQYLFPGLKEGDVWCLCAQRWFQAFQAGKAPQVFLQATHEKTLDFVPYEVLMGYAIDAEEARQSLHELNELRAKLNKLL